MNRFVGELLAAGEPLSVCARAAESVQDEIRHAELCAEACGFFGVDAATPQPPELIEPLAFTQAPARDRAAATAISMLLVSETISVGFIEDLRDRCENPPIAKILRETLADEDEHQEAGWSYVSDLLKRYPSRALKDFRHLVRSTVEPHRNRAEEILAKVANSEPRLELFPEPELARWGLHSPERQALVFQRTWAKLRPRLEALGLT